jgi:hypothetical protein
MAYCAPPLGPPLGEFMHIIPHSLLSYERM